MSAALSYAPTRAQIARFTESERQRTALLAVPFAQQLRFLRDQSPRKAVLCSRRAGKSMAVAIDIALAHLRWPGAVTLYCGITATTARAIMWPLLEELNEACMLGLEFKTQRSEVVAANGSITRFVGLDAAEKEKKKSVGQKYPKVWIDEAQDFRIRLRELVDRRLGPALLDHGGQLCMLGTPGDFIGPGGDNGQRRHYFFAVTKQVDSTGRPLLYPDEPLEPDWSVHRWGTLDNPFMREKFQRQLDRIREKQPRFMESANYRRDYLGLWSIDTDRLVYRYDDRDNVVDAAPELESMILGVDLGWNNATAFTVAGWQKYDPTLYFVRAFKRRQLTLTAVAEEIRKLQAKHDPNWIVVDGANKQAVEELCQRQELPLKAAEKVGKPDFIRQMNDDLAKGRIKVVRGACDDLLDEWGTLVWDDRAVSGPRELPSCENDASDSALYAWRAAKNYLTEERPKPKTHQNSEDWADEMWKGEERRMRDAGFADDDRNGGWRDG